MINQTHLDTILIERSQLGDLNAFDELFGKYRNKAYMYALKLTNHVEDASDVVTESFIRVHRAIDRFQANSSFSTWMFKIIRNCFLDTRKKRRVNVVCSLDTVIESEEGLITMQPIDESESAFDYTARSVFTDQVRAFLDAMPERQREMLVMYYQDQLTYDEMSIRLSTPAGTIKSRLHRAKFNLRSLMESDPQWTPLAC